MDEGDDVHFGTWSLVAVDWRVLEGCLGNWAGGGGMGSNIPLIKISWPFNSGTRICDE